MGNPFRKLLVATVLAIAAVVPGYCAAPDAKLVQAFTTVTTGTAYSLPAVGVYYHVMQWSIAGAPASCTVKVQQSIDNTNWSDLIAAQTCTSNGQSGFIAGSTLYVRFNVTALTAGATLQVIYTGYTQNPAPAASGALASQVQGAGTSGAAVVGAPVLVGGKNASGNLQPIGTDGFGNIGLGPLTSGADGQSNTSNLVAPFGGNVGAGLAGLISAEMLFNGTTWDRNRTAAAATTGNAVSIGADLVEKGGRWSVTSAPAVSTIGSAVKAAGGAGVRHVTDCVSFSAGAITAPTATQLTINLRDGASGAGTVIWTKSVVLPATSGTHVVGDFCGLNLIGTAATAMTLEFSALLTNEFESVTITGYDVQ